MSEHGTPRRTKTSVNPPARSRSRSPARASNPEGASPALTAIFHEEIAARAYGLFLSRGGQHGDDWGDWFRAEADLRIERASGGSPSRQ